MFLTEPEPERGPPAACADGVWRIVAPNPGPMTYHGTNTYLLGTSDGWLVLDPGPDDAAHRAAVMAATGGCIAAILLSHAHRDHAGGVAALAQETGALVHGWAGTDQGAGGERRIDRRIADRARVFGLTALWTPGHAPDHLCFVRDDGVLFSGDHVMTWSSTAVAPPSGDMAEYVASLERLAAWPARRLLPGHGPPMDEPGPFLDALLAHRARREQALVAILRLQPSPLPKLVERLYRGLDARRRRAAELTTLAHLQKLETEARAVQDGVLWRLVETA